MKKLIICFIFLSSLNAIAGCKDESICLFKRPLIVGASISQGVGAKPGGPGKIIAQTINPKSKTKIIAKHKKKSTESMINYIETKAPSIVIGLDLFFWDAVENDCGDAFDTHARSFFKDYRDRKIPLIIGKLPTGVSEPSGYRKLNGKVCTETINQLINEECTLEKNCLIYDPKDCLEAMKLEPKAVAATFFADNLHTSDKGNQFCANFFLLQKSYKLLQYQGK